MQYKSNNIIKNFRKKLKKKYVTSAWMQLSNTNLTELLCASYFDAVTFDFEHGVFSFKDLPDLVRVTELYDKVSLVRLPNKNLEFCKQALDAGVNGIIIPNIKSFNETKKIIDNCYLPPKGQRGVGFSRVNKFGKKFGNYIKRNFKPIIIPMIENIEGVNDLDMILQLKELDAILIGPYDLSASLKITGKFKHKQFKNTLNKIKLKCKNHRVPCGVHIIEPELKNLKKLVKNGFKFLPYGIDTDIFNKSLTKIFKKK